MTAETAERREWRRTWAGSWLEKTEAGGGGECSSLPFGRMPPLPPAALLGPSFTPLLVLLLLLLLLFGPGGAFTAPSLCPRQGQRRWLLPSSPLAATTTGRPVAAPTPAPPPLSAPPVGKGKGAGAGDGMSNGKVTARLMELTTAAEVRWMMHRDTRRVLISASIIPLVCMCVSHARHRSCRWSRARAGLRRSASTTSSRPCRGRSGNPSIHPCTHARTHPLSEKNSRGDSSRTPCTYACVTQTINQAGWQSWPPRRKGHNQRRTHDWQRSLR